MLEEYVNNNSIPPKWEVRIIKKFVASINDLRIVIYPLDHNLPHFHVTSTQKNINARFWIYNGKYINDVKWVKLVPTQDIKKIEDFF